MLNRIADQVAHAAPGDLYAQAQQDEGRDAQEDDGAGLAQRLEQLVGIAVADQQDDADHDAAHGCAQHIHHGDGGRVAVQQTDANGDGGGQAARPVGEREGQRVEGAAACHLGREGLGQLLSAALGRVGVDHVPADHGH